MRDPSRPAHHMPTIRGFARGACGPAWRKIEFFGGPWDGRVLSFIGEPEDLCVKGTGHGTLRYCVDEIHEGPSVRTVLRYVAAAPVEEFEEEWEDDDDGRI